VGTLRPAGLPRLVTLAPAPGRAGRRLYYLVAVPAAADPAGDRSDGGPPPATAVGVRWRLTGVDPATLERESEHDVPDLPVGLAVAPDGDEAYLLTGSESLLSGDRLVRLNLTTGLPDRGQVLPGEAQSLAVTRERVYVPNPWGREVWVVDRRGGGLMRPVAVGHGPVGLALSGPG
jgi:hypothetical protein